MNKAQRLKKSFIAALVTGLALSLLAIPQPASAAAPAVTSTTTTLVPSGSTTNLTGMSVSGYTTETLLVSLSTSLGSLSMTSTTNLTLSYGYSSFSGSSFSFTGTQTDINNALATLTLSTSAGVTGTAQVSINVTQNQTGVSYLPANGHFYQYVASAGGTWASAAAAAGAHTFNGQTGYLATIPNSTVNSFVEAHLNGASNVWAGGADVEYPSGFGGNAGIKRVWSWQGGPLQGQVFTECSNVNGTCALVNDTGNYHDWNAAEPNNSGYNGTPGSGEEQLEINYIGNGTWNDLGNTDATTSGYVIEYGDNASGGNFTGVYSGSTNVAVATVPDAPTAVNAVAGSGEVTVSYATPVSNGNASITSYTIKPFLGGVAQSPIAFNNTNTSQTVTGLTDGGSYTFEVAATNAVGTDAFSTLSNAVTATVPITPTIPMPTGGATATTPNGTGYWSLDPSGELSNFGDAPNLGSENAASLNAPIVTLNATSNGDGYWLGARDGGVFAYGTANFYGSMAAQPLNQPVVALARSSSNAGYWLVASDGGVFAFGDAQFFGSMGGKPINQPVAAVTRTPSGKGYWMVGADGGVFAFGDAQFYGSMGGSNLNKHVVGIASTPDGGGYWMVAADGGVFAFGDAGFYGSLGGSGSFSISGIIANGNNGYRLIDTAGRAYPFGTNP